MHGSNRMTAAVLTLALAGAAGGGAAAQDVRIDSHGVRAGGVVIDSSGVHGPGADVTASGVRTGSHGRRGHGAGVTIMDNRRVASIDCAGGPATVMGNRNTLTLNRCSGLSAPGNRNHIVVGLTAGASIEVTGNDNVISYQAPSGTSARVSSVGSGNRITAD